MFTLTSGNRTHNLGLGQILPGQLSYHPAVSHDYQPGTGTEHLVGLRRNEGHAHAFTCQLQYQLLDIHLGADIDTSRRLIQDQIFRMGQKLSG